MQDGMLDSGRIDHPAWPQRALLLAGLGALIGLLIRTLTGGTAHLWSDHPLPMATAAFLAVAGVALAFSLERLRWIWSVAFAVAAGLVVALVGWWNGAPGEWGAGEGWQFFASLLAAAVALPLFQAARDAGGPRFAAEPALFHAWTNLILWFAGWAFALASFLLVLLLGALFDLIGIDVIRTLFDAEWPLFMLICGAFGGAIGLLRDRDAVVGTLQTVVRAILSVLAPVLAVGLVLFVIALVPKGLQPLWEKTKSTTPIVLACLLGAIVLVNAVLGNRPEEEAKAAPLRWAGMALAAVMLPLALVAAVSTGKRIGQYGFTPDRLWAAVFVAVALVFAASYLMVLVRGRSRWGDGLRRANVRLAAFICLLALFLALPIVSFGALSTRDQVARLEQGSIAPDRFDWAALRFDFGPSGRRALDRLARSNVPAVRAKAGEALKATDRWALRSPDVEAAEQRRRDPPKILVTPAGAAAPAALVDAVAVTGQCTVDTCRLDLQGGSAAVLLSAPCANCPAQGSLFERQADGSWRAPAGGPRSLGVDATAAPGVPKGRVEVRTVSKRRIFVDGKPIGDTFD